MYKMNNEKENFRMRLLFILLHQIIVLWYAYKKYGRSGTSSSSLYSVIPVLSSTNEGVLMYLTSLKSFLHSSPFGLVNSFLLL